MTIHEFKLFADYHQFYVKDDFADGDLSDSWSEESIQQALGVAPGIIGIGTIRAMTVPVTIEVRTGPPAFDDFGEWDRINECSISIPSGRLVVAGCSDYLPDAPRILLIPGIYRARIYYGGYATIHADGLEGDDRYRVVLWTEPYSNTCTLKEPK